MSIRRTFFRQARIPSGSSRQLRFVLFALIALFIWTLVWHSGDNVEPPIVRRPVKDTSGPNSDLKPTSSPFRIQATFKEENKTSKNIRLDRQKHVRKAFVHAWTGYKKHAWLHDEVMPISGGSKDPFAGWAATLVDGLDALYILGLHDEFEKALKALKSIDFTKPKADRVPVFETTIRYLGGLLGAYDVSEGKYPILLKKADELGEFLFLAFNTPNGIPVPYYSWGKPDEKLEGSSGVLVAQVGSLSLEFTRLAQLTGKRKYFDAITKVMKYFEDAQTETQIPGLWPSQIDTISPSFNGLSFTLGAWADSLYEYLPKEHILLNGRSDNYLRMYRTALAPSQSFHFFRPKTPGNQDILFSGALGAVDGKPNLQTEVQHLACFVGGMVGLGSRINSSPEELATAIKLTDGCVWAYQNTATGIMPEIFHVDKCPATGSCEWGSEEGTEPGHQYGFTSVDDKSYQLRPEAIESVFIMYRITGDPIWQEKGWTMFQAIMKYTTTSIANARLADVTNKDSLLVDSMESFWLAETLKYFFLLFSEPDVVSLDDFVLNTEAHPFRQRDHLFEI